LAFPFGVRDGLRLFEEQEQQRLALRKALIAGEKSGVAGLMDIERIKQKGRERLQEKRKRA